MTQQTIFLSVQSVVGGGDDDDATHMMQHVPSIQDVPGLVALVTSCVLPITAEDVT